MNYSEYDAETLFSVGRRFLNGDCVEKDIAKAKAMLGRAAEMGHPLARKLMESISDDIQEEKDDMTEWRKMRSGDMYDWTDPVIDRSLTRSRLACEKFNKSGIDHDDYRTVLEEMIPDVPKSVTILPPFHCDHGNGLHLGEGVFVNYNGMFLDAGDITIGAHTLIGPNCSLYTPQHPIDYRRVARPLSRLSP